MDIVNLQAYNGSSFVFSRVLTPWADLYPLGSGTFRAQMRVKASSHVVLFEWSSANGRATFDESAANGSIAFTLNPAPASSITLGTTVVTFVASGATGNQVNIAGSLALTLQALLTKLQASVDAQIIQCSYSIIASTLSVVYNTSGTLGNSFALATTVTGATVSGALLSGAGGLLTLTATVADVSEFVGDYVYDCDFTYFYTDGAAVIPMFGGSLIFNQGVTRT